jgi:NhaP-type Na+/H+ or K+/H+ antiporter
LIERLIDLARSLAALAIVLVVVGTPAVIAVACVSRRAEQGLDWGSRRKLWSVGISLLLIFLLTLLFSYILQRCDSLE